MHIILCSDNSAVRESVSRPFSELGDRLTICESGMELLAAAKAMAADAVVLDLGTHGLGGLLLVSAVKELAPSLPIVAVSMRSESEPDVRPLLQKGVPYVRLGSDANERCRELIDALARQPGAALSVNAR